jgi:hypothetical protein
MCDRSSTRYPPEFERGRDALLRVRKTEREDTPTPDPRTPRRRTRRERIPTDQSSLVQVKRLHRFNRRLQNLESSVPFKVRFDHSPGRERR